MAISTPGNIFCMYDPMCLGVECCLNVKLFMFLYTVKAYARYDPCDYTLNVGLQGYNYTIRLNMGNDGKCSVFFNLDRLRQYLPCDYPVVCCVYILCYPWIWRNKCFTPFDQNWRLEKGEFSRIGVQQINIIWEI